ncbi:NAD(P)H-dependent flavin oxidoreductase [Lacrimispora sp. 210928-DFI.3.58]|uniref:NAD(P)H-dependent flavin oxidoreductase n=1 Tax=Lacrimispora sp. 210928-DFI.3.58 TaxID=2883214 RepID=UPI0015B508F0|nr:nitronate monooxygenase family protein [Lacrimispora sp. 210928-DFI.3.58]MCB7318511.1 nitronate monooxygenase family protein [Lacrimispora sp. 210928-DFI.3.58]
MNKLKPLVIGDLEIVKPIIQGGMGVGISLHKLAGAVAKAGGMGIISSAQIGFMEPDFTTNFVEANLRAIRREMKAAREISPEGAIGFNIMVASRHYDMWVKEAVKAGADIIISGAGLPVSLPDHVKAAYEEMKAAGLPLPKRRIKMAPIVSSAKSASVICRMWDRKAHTAPDLVVIEGPLAGGHLGFSKEQLTAYGADTEDVPATYHKDEYDEEIKKIIQVVKEYGEKYGKHIPVVTAGGIYTHEDVLHQLELGAEGVQVATRFVTTKECDASEAYKESYIKACKEDIVITQSPVGMPGRAILNPFLSQIKEGIRPAIKSCFQCLEKCDIRTIPYCITQALVNAATGDVDNALLFCGSNAYRAERMETVDEVMDALMGI